MARDFLTSQVRTGKIIGNNTPESEPKLIVYSDSDASDNAGSYSNALQARINALPDTTFIYIDGIPGSKKSGTANTVAVFGGDVVIKGDLYAEGNVSSMWELDPTDSNNLIPTNIIDGSTGLFAMDFGELSYIQYNDLIKREIQVEDYSRYIISNKDCALDELFEVDTTFSGYESIVPKD